TAMVAALWAYDGWIELTYVGGEVRDPERNLPRSIVLSTLIAIALYCLVTASFTYVLSPAKMAAASLVASDAAQVTLGHVGAGLIAVAIMISTLGSNNGIVLTAARVPRRRALRGRTGPGAIRSRRSSSSRSRRGWWVIPSPSSRATPGSAPR